MLVPHPVEVRVVDLDGGGLDRVVDGGVVHRVGVQPVDVRVVDHSVDGVLVDRVVVGEALRVVLHLEEVTVHEEGGVGEVAGEARNFQNSIVHVTYLNSMHIIVLLKHTNTLTSTIMFCLSLSLPYLPYIYTHAP